MIRVAFLQENVRTGQIRIVKIGTDDQLADPLTKALDTQKHWKFLARLVSNLEDKTCRVFLCCQDSGVNKPDYPSPEFYFQESSLEGYLF